MRHAAHAQLGRIFTGRLGGIALDREGREQSRRLALRLAAERPTVVQTSPRARACETARAIATEARLPSEVTPALDEIDAGDWTGRSFAELANDPRWVHWNAQRGTARIPAGESMAEVQSRVVRHIEAFAGSAGAVIVMVTHAEVIRATVLHCRGLPLDAFGAIEIAPASITTIAIAGGRARLVAVNETLPVHAGAAGPAVAADLPEA